MEAVTDFLVEDLLDFPAGDDTIITDALFLDSPHPNNVTNNSNNSTGSSTPVHSSNSSSLSQLCLPYDDLEELEWLSNFVEESFSTDIAGSTQIHPDPLIKPAATMVPAKARSKLSRVAPSDWSTRVLMVTVPKKSVMRRREGPNSPEGEARRCLHCASEKTPQWRTGPMGPKTLCNACGVRYKSGRLVPEYRPASSPTFLATKHSNSHRKVMELRRQKEMHIQRRHQQQQQQQFLGQANDTVFGISSGDDYLIHRHLGAV